MRVAAPGPLGCKPFLPLPNGEKWIPECEGTRGAALWERGPGPDDHFLSLGPS